MPLLLPFFKFHVTDWLTSEKIALMNVAQVGAYIMLLAHCWTQQTCTLPSDLTVLKKLSKWEPDTPGDFGCVLSCFTRLTKTGRLTNRRLYTEWQEARSRTERFRQAGHQGATKRWQPLREKKQAKATRPKRLNGNTPFPPDWKLTPEEITKWQQHGLNPHIEFATFKDHALSVNRRVTDWPAAYRNWCRKSLTRKESHS